MLIMDRLRDLHHLTLNLRRVCLLALAPLLEPLLKVQKSHIEVTTYYKMQIRSMLIDLEEVTNICT